MNSTPFEEPHGDPDYMNSLARGLRVIRAFSEFRHHLSMAQVSQSTGLSRAAVRRCLHTLKLLGYVGEQDKRFFLRPQVLALGHAYLVSTPLAVAAQPYLDEVSKAVHESCSAAILDVDDVVYMCRSAENRVVSTHLLVGTRLPAYCTSLGHALLAHLPESELEAYLSRVRLVERTNSTTATVPALRQALQRVRELGYALLDQELEVGLRSIAVPVRDLDGQVRAAVNVGANAGRVSVERMRAQVLPVLYRCAEQLKPLLRA